MKVILLAAALLLLSVFGYSQNNLPDCTLFRTGTFSYRDSTENAVRTFIRKNKTQIETTINSKNKTKFRIKWLSDCEYKLTQIWTNDKKRKILNFRYWIYTIIPVTEKSFSYSCNCGNGKVVSGVVVVKTD